MKISDSDVRLAVKRYEYDCEPLANIAADLGVSRQALWKRFRKLGVETAKGLATRRKLTCDYCGEEYEVTRSQYRIKVKNKRNFCTDTCYHLYLRSADTVYNRHMSRVSRDKVSKFYDLAPGNVVHHRDKNQFNTDINNLMVFKNHSDHVKYHHQLRQGEVTVKPVFDGGDFGLI